MKKRSDNTTGVTGISHCKATGKFKAYIRVNYHLIHLGRHNSLGEAIQVREVALQMKARGETPSLERIKKELENV